MNKGIKISLIVFGCLFLFALIITGLSSPVNKELNSLNENEDFQFSEEQIYLNYMIDFNSVYKQNMDHVVDVSNAGANGDITFSDAGRLYKVAGENFELLLDVLDNVKVPMKFQTCHIYYRNSLIYMVDGMDLASDGSYSWNADLIYQGVDKINLATIEINKANVCLN